VIAQSFVDEPVAAIGTAARRPVGSVGSGATADRSATSSGSTKRLKFPATILDLHWMIADGVLTLFDRYHCLASPVFGKKQTFWRPILHRDLSTFECCIKIDSRI
jgi:hypothetical protein